MIPIDASTAAAMLANVIQKTIPESQPETGINFLIPILVCTCLYLTLVYFAEQIIEDSARLNSPHVSRPNSPVLSTSAPDLIGNTRSSTFIVYQETFYLSIITDFFRKTGGASSRQIG